MMIYIINPLGLEVPMVLISLKGIGTSEAITTAVLVKELGGVAASEVNQSSAMHYLTTLTLSSALG